MQVAAMSPQYLSPEEIPAQVLEQERSIRMEQAKLQNKPEPVMLKMVDGQMAKWCKEVCLMDQTWIKDPDGKKDIKGLLTDLIGKIGENIKVRRFVRYEVGEGLVKRADDFVEEVKRQAGQG